MANMKTCLCAASVAVSACLPLRTLLYCQELTVLLSDYCLLYESFELGEVVVIFFQAVHTRFCEPGNILEFEMNSFSPKLA